MPNYPNKRHLIRLYQMETRRVIETIVNIDEETEVETSTEVEVEKAVKVYYKYPLTAATCPEKEYDPANEGLDLKAYIRQLSANERNAARAIQDDSDIEVAINRRRVRQDMYMEFKGKVYQIGASDYFNFEGTEIKFRAKEVVPEAYDAIEYRRYA